MSSKTPIADRLPAGRENAVPLTAIQSWFDLGNRQARKAIELERQNGGCILSTTEGRGGYYRPANAKEAERFAIAQRHRARQILRSAETAAMTARRMREAEKDSDAK